ncbi:MAG: DNA translocase FtsK [Spirochaetota bacterium]|jgi:S-DNA-T family DNA segregation ATPase FtsK/SpoIIIE|nr:DNA translocase FtsK [Spirochaetota bacterium]
MAERKRRISLIVAAGVLVMASASAAVTAMAFLAVESAPLTLVVGWVNDHLSFAADGSPWGLVPLPIIFIALFAMVLAIRRGKRIFYLFIPLVSAMAYTLYTLSHMVVESARPYLASALLESSDSWRGASLKVVIAFLAEMALFIIVILVADALSHMKSERAVRQKKRHETRARPAEKQKKKKSQAKPPQQPKVDENAQKPVDPSPFAVVDIPAMESFSRPYTPPQRVESTPQSDAELGKLSTGALHVMNEERKRKESQGSAQQRQQELSVRPTKEKGKSGEGEPLSGFLVGALEAIGRPSKKHSAETPRPKGRGRGMLVEAVAKAQVHQEQPMVVKERIEAVTVEEPKCVDMPVRMEERPAVSIQEPESVVEPVREQAKPPAPVEEPAGVEVAEEDDPLEPSNGIGGLVRGEGRSALLNRGKIGYKYPPESMLETYEKIGDVVDTPTIKRGELLVATLAQFSISVELTNIVRGPTVTMFELLPAPGVRVNSIANLTDNIALALAATQVRIVAPIPGKSAVGVEIPNAKRDIIGFREMLPFLKKELGVPMVLGRDLLNRGVVIDVMKSPHLLIAGSTGSGKSVCVNSLICSILFTRSPREVRLILVDPKIVELNIYNGIPHLLTPVITDAKRTLKALDFALYEMDRRYRLLQSIGVRNIIGYNEKIKANALAREKLPYIVIIIDEFADLMHLVGKEMETKVSRLAAMSRAVGIHLVLATQRPSVDVITGVIKNNIPTRIAFAVTSSTDSRIILDEMGAEKLLGRGDMLYQSSSEPASVRIQGSFLSDQEVEDVVAFVARQGEPDYIDESFFEEDEPKAAGESSSDGVDLNDDEALMEEALAIVVERKSASASYLQRRLKIGYNRAARLVEQMEEMGYVGPPNGSKPRELIKYP